MENATTMLTKGKVTEALSELPGEFSLDDFVDRLIFIQKVETGLRQSEQDKVFSTEEACTLLKQ